jgi:hypothetical protein
MPEKMNPGALSGTPGLGLVDFAGSDIDSSNTLTLSALQARSICRRVPVGLYMAIALAPFLFGERP